jgi:hypothetical protein
VQVRLGREALQRGFVGVVSAEGGRFDQKGAGLDAETDRAV